MSDPDEWVTVAEAAARLKIHARQARRYAARLGTEDRTPEGQSPLKVRMSSLLSFLDSSQSDRSSKDRDRTPSRTGTGTKDSVPPVSLPSDQRHIEHMEAEIAFLRGQLEEAGVERSELRRLLLIEQDAVKRLTSAPKMDDSEAAPAVELPASASPAIVPGDLGKNAAVSGLKTTNVTAGHVEAQKRSALRRAWDWLFKGE